MCGRLSRKRAGHAAYHAPSRRANQSLGHPLAAPRTSPKSQACEVPSVTERSLSTWISMQTREVTYTSWAGNCSVVHIRPASINHLALSHISAREKDLHKNSRGAAPRLQDGKGKPHVECSAVSREVTPLLKLATSVQCVRVHGRSDKASPCKRRARPASFSFFFFLTSVVFRHAAARVESCAHFRLFKRTDTTIREARE